MTNELKLSNGMLERQLPSSDVLKLIRDELMVPSRPHRDPDAASSKARQKMGEDKSRLRPRS